MHPLEKYRQKYEVWVNDRTHSLDITEREEIQQIIRTYWEPGYTCMMWCGACVGAMIEKAFKYLDNELNSNGGV